MASDLSIGKLSGIIELEDRFSEEGIHLAGIVEDLDERFGGLTGKVIESAAGFFTAEAAMEAFKESVHFAAETLQELTIGGSKALDVEQAFEHLTENAGLLGDQLLGRMREGLHGTVTDMDLMKRVNENLAAGLNLSTNQMEVLTQGAFALSKMTGGTVTEALDRMSDAMVKGQVRGVALLTGKINLKDAEEQYAAKIGTTVDHLDPYLKQLAIQEAILQRVEASTDRVGEVQLRLADKVQQSQVAFSNFKEEVGEQLAPVVEDAFDRIRSIIIEAFGTDQETAIATITYHVQNLANVSVSSAKNIVDAFATAKQIFIDYKSEIEAVAFAIGGYYAATTTIALGSVALNAALKLTVAAFSEVTAATVIAQGGLIGASFALGAFIGYKLGDLQPISDFFQGLALKVQGYSDAEVASMIATTHANEAALASYDPLKEAQDKAKKDAEDLKVKNEELAASHNKSADAAREHAKQQEIQSHILQQTAAETKKYNDALMEINNVGATWQDTLAGINPGLIEDAKQMLAAGASAEKLGTAWGLLPPIMKAIQLSAKDDAEALKEQIAQEAELTKAVDAYYKSVAALSHDTMAAQIQDAYLTADARIAALAKTKAYSVEAEMAIWATADNTARLIQQRDLESNVNSKAHYQLLADQARIAYERIKDDHDNFTQDFINHEEDLAIAAELAAARFGMTYSQNLDKVKQKAVEATAALQAMHGLAFRGTPVPADILASVAGMSGLSRDLEVSRQMRNRGLTEFGEGGPVLETGLALVHAGEFVLPKGSSGNLQIINHIYGGNSEDVANKVITRIEKVLRQSKQWPSL